jgi:thiazole/oxazole-forming peptide maturase SagD family component
MINGRMPLLDPRAELFEVDPFNALLKADELLFQFRGRGTLGLLLALDGCVTLDTLTARHGRSVIESVLERLTRAGLIYWMKPEEVGVDVGTNNEKLPGILHDACGQTLQVLLTDSYFRPGLGDDVECAQRSGIPLVLLKPGISTIWLGPIFASAGVPCWDCFLKRLTSQDDILAVLKRCTYRPRIPVRLNLYEHESSRVAAGYIRDYVTGSRSALDLGVLLEIDGASGKTKIHRIVPGSDCSRSGCQAQLRAYGLPSEAPHGSLWEIVKERMTHAIDSVTGITSEPGVCSSADSAVQVAVARYADPTAGKLCEYALDEATGRLIRSSALSRSSFGGGKTSTDARARAVLEGVERYCGVVQSMAKTVCATYKELGDTAIHPNRLMNYSAEQLEHPNISATEICRELRIPMPFDEQACIHWTPVKSESGATKYLPTAHCFEAVDIQPDASFCVHDNNGSAVGLTWEDAILRGFLELIERDAVGIWWYNRIARPIVRLRTFDDPFIERVIAEHHGLGRKVAVFDITNDFGIPVFAAVSMHATIGPLFGFGAHFDAHRALVGALIELGQGLCFATQEQKKWEGVDWQEQHHLKVSDSDEQGCEIYTRVSEAPCVQTCIDAAAARALEFFILDCTRTEIGLPAVRVIVPGLRHLWPRFGPGRIWDVPVTLGWLSRPTTSDEVNPEYFRS